MYIYFYLQVKAKYRAQVDHLRGQLQSAEQTNAQLNREVAALTEQLAKLRCSTDGSTNKIANGNSVVIKQERRDSSDSNTTLDCNTCTVDDEAIVSPGNDQKGYDPSPSRPVTTT